MNMVLKVSDYTGDSINFAIITWILLALLTNKTLHETLKFRILYLLNTTTTSQTNDAEYLLHKITLIKELQEDEQIPTSESSKYAFRYLVSMHQCRNLELIFGLNEQQVPELKLESLSDLPKETMNKIFLLYSEKLLKKYPKNSLVKLHFAYRSFKNKESYAKTIKIIGEIQKYKWSKNYLGSSLLLHDDVEKSILENVQKNYEEGLNFSAYIKSMAQVENLKKNMLEQTNLNLKICNNMLNNSCDIEEIHCYSQKIGSVKTMIQQSIEKLSLDLSEYFISPYLLYAEYHLVANHSKDNFEKYHEIYIQKYRKAQNAFQDLTLIEENLYQDSNALVLISTQKSEYGKILYCNNPLIDICGGKNLDICQGSNLSILFPKILKDYYESLLRVNDEEDSMGKIHRAFLFNKDKHLVEVDFCFKYRPFLTQGLCLSMIIRPVPVSEDVEFLLLSENGEIEGASKYLSRLLGLNKISASSIISIRDFSDELYYMNNAVNVIVKNNNKDDNVKSSQRKEISKFMRAKSILQSPDFKPQCPEISYAEAKAIYTNFTSEGQEFQFKKNKKEDHKEKFHSIVKILDYGSLKMKLVTLNRIGQKDNGQKELKILQKIELEDFDFEENIAPVYTDYRENRLMTTERRYLIGETLITDFSQVQSPNIKLLAPSPRETPRMSLLQESTESSRIGHFKMSYIRRKNHRFTDSQSSMERRSVEKAENKIFRQAILSKSYPKSFSSLCFIFYLVILLTFAGQLIMKSVSDSTMQDLQIKTTLFKNSEEKSYKGALVQLNGRGTMLLILQLIDIGATYPGIAQTISNLQIRIGDMKQASDNMLEYVYTLDQETQNKLLAQNVRVDATYLESEDESYMYVDIFQITSEAVNAGKALAGVQNPSGTAGYHIANYLRKNFVDDFLYRSTKITDILSETVEKQKESLQYITNLFLTLNPLLLTGIGILLCSIIWNQYRIERENMKAFVKIPSEGVSRVQERFTP